MLLWLLLLSSCSRLLVLFVHTGVVVGSQNTGGTGTAWVAARGSLTLALGLESVSGSSRSCGRLIQVSRQGRQQCRPPIDVAVPPTLFLKDVIKTLLSNSSNALLGVRSHCCITTIDWIVAVVASYKQEQSLAGCVGGLGRGHLRSE